MQNSIGFLETPLVTMDILNFIEKKAKNHAQGSEIRNLFSRNIKGQTNKKILLFIIRLMIILLHRFQWFYP